MEFHYKNRGFDWKKNFEIEPSLGMGVKINIPVSEDHGYIVSLINDGIILANPIQLCIQLHVRSKRRVLRPSQF